MTYGWAILIIAVALAVLYQLGVFSQGSLAPRAQPGSCQVERFASQTSLEGQCTGRLPEFVAGFGHSVSYITVPDSTSLDIANNVTISAWVYTTGGGDEFVLTHNSTNSGDYRLGWNAFPTEDSYLTYYPSGGTTDMHTSVSSASLNSWANIALTYDYSSNSLILYYNGTQVDVGSGASPASQLRPRGSLLIGAVLTSLATDFNGLIANVQLYNASLSSSEVKQIYQSGIGGVPVRIQNIVGWWPLNGNANDYSGMNNNGAIVGNVVFNSTWSSTYTPP